MNTPFCPLCDHCTAHLMAGANIRAVRKSKGLSLRYMADAVGISPMYLSDIERGNRRVRIADGVGKRIAEYLGIEAVGE